MDTLVSRPMPKTAPPDIRLAVREDLAELHAMIGELAAHHGDTATISAEALDRIALRGAGVRVLVARVRGGVAGYALLVLRPNLVTGHAGYEVNHLFIRAAHRRQGLGRALVGAARELAQSEGRSQLWISATPANAAAAMAYRAMGLAEQPPAGPRFLVPLE